MWVKSRDWRLLKQPIQIPCQSLVTLKPILIKYAAQQLPFWLPALARHMLTANQWLSAASKCGRRKQGLAHLSSCVVYHQQLKRPQKISREHIIKWRTGWQRCQAYLHHSMQWTMGGSETAHSWVLKPRTVASGTKLAPDEILEMVRCGCDKSACRGAICKCSLIGCTVFCACEAGSLCLNPLTKRSDVEDEGDDCW